MIIWVILQSSSVWANDCTNWFWRFDRAVELHSKLDFVMDSNQGQYSIKVLDKEKKLVGALAYELLSVTKAHISYISVEPSYQRSGLATNLIFLMMANHPQLEEVRFLVGGVNEDILQENYRSGVGIWESVQKTPLYKLLSLHGFEQIVLEKTIYQINDQGTISFMILCLRRDKIIVNNLTILE